MTRLAVIGDVHSRRSRLVRVLDWVRGEGVEGILLVGDIGAGLPTGRPATAVQRAKYLANVDKVLDLVHALGLPVAYVPGNHDLPDLALPGNVDHAVLDIAGLRVAGLGGAPDYRQDPYEWPEDAARLRDIPDHDVLLAHTPPARTPLDRVPKRNKHVGSEAIREMAEAGRGVLVCGHIHESPGACRIGDTLCMNVGGLGRPHGKAQVGWIALRGGSWVAGHHDLESGVAREWTLETAPVA